MRVLNVMSSKILGGLEQVFLDYNKALSSKGYTVFAMYNKYGKIKNKLEELPSVKYISKLFFRPYILLFPFMFFTVLRLRPNLIIVHSRKVLPLFTKIGFILRIPVAIVTHNTKLKLLHKADYIFSITKYQKDIFVSNNFDPEKIFVVPNMVSFNKDYKELTEYSNLPVIGVMGRFDPMKGFIPFISSCNILKSRGVKFKIKISGSPQMQYIDEYKKLKRVVRYCNLQNDTEFTGWIDNKDDFFNNIDIFVLPSVYEPFGIILLEAMMYSKPIISSLAEGPREIFNNTEAALTYEPKDHIKLADLMEEMIKNIDLAKKTAKNGYDLVNSKYTLEEIANVLEKAVQNAINRKKWI